MAILDQAALRVLIAGTTHVLDRNGKEAYVYFDTGDHQAPALFARSSTSIHRRFAPDSSAEKVSVVRGDWRSRRCWVPPVGACSRSVSQASSSV